MRMIHVVSWQRWLSAFSLLGLFACQMTSRLHADDWPAFLGPTGDSKSREKGISTDWPAEGPPRLWHVELGEGYGTCAVANGRVYLFDFIDGEARCRALNEKDGSEEWRFTYPSRYQDLYQYNRGPRCAPIVDNQRVYFYGVAGILHSLDATSGELVWKKNLSEEYGVVQNFFGVGSCPVVWNRLLLVAVGGSPASSRQAPPGQLDRVEPNRSAIVALDKETGQEIYRVGNDLASYASPKIVRFGESEPVLGFYARRPALFRSGKRRRRIPLPVARRTNSKVSTPAIRSLRATRS